MGGLGEVETNEKCFEIGHHGDARGHFPRRCAHGMWNMPKAKSDEVIGSQK